MTTDDRISMRTRMRRSPGAGKLTAVRFASQFGDGLFQAALSGAILFNPEREADPVAIAAGFAVLLVPYSILGPFAGALLDRWDRRSVLLWANVLRGLLILAAAALIGTGGGETPLLLLALSAVGVSRFVLAGTSASLPHVIRREWLVPMNSILATVGSGFAAGGAGAAVAVIGLIGAGNAASGVAVLLAVSGSVVGAIAAGTFPPRALGPDGTPMESNVAATMKAVAGGLLSGARAVWQSSIVTTAMTGIGAHRIVFGIDTLIFVLVLRQSTGNDGLPSGLAGFGVAVGATAAGMLLAAIVTPFVLPKFGRTPCIAVSLVIAAIVQGSLIAGLTQQSLLIGAFLLGLAGQVIKLTGDSAMQMEIDDERRGRVFALQDTVFNVAFVGAIAVAAVAIGSSTSDVAASTSAHVLAYAGSGVYLVALIAVGLIARMRRG